MVWGLFGLDAKSQAEREATNLTGGRQEFNDWDLGDRFRSAITGVSKDDVLKRAQDIAGTRINEANTKLIGDTRRSMNGTGLEGGALTIGLGETEGQFQDRLTDDLNRGTAARTLMSLPGSEGIEIAPDAQVADLVGFARDARKNETERVRQEKLTDNATAHSNALAVGQQGITAANNRFNAQLKQQSGQFAHTASESAKDRALTRDLDLSKSNMQMQMKFMDMDLADKRMAYDRETRRMDKRDRMMAQLMQGLGQLGGAFAL